MQTIDFNKVREFAGGTFLLHGNYGTGKTHLLGDMLRTESARGPVAFFNLKGEDGFTTLADLGDVPNLTATTVETYDELVKGLEAAKQAKTVAVGLDGFQRIYPFSFVKKLGSNRTPVIGGSTNEWAECHKLVEDLTDSLRYYAPIVFCTSSTDKSVDQVKGETHLTPNFAGRNAAGIAGHFDFVFFLDSTVLGPNKIKRTLLTAPVSKMVLRYRLPSALPTEIEMPNGVGGWALVRKAIETALQKPKPPAPAMAKAA